MEKRRHDFKKNSLLAYMVSFGIVVTAIIIAMGVYLYWFYYNKIEADFLRENDTYVSTICDIHEREIGTLDTISVEMYLSRNTVEFKLAENPLKNLTLKEQLFRYQSVNTFFSNLFCIYHEDHYLFNSTTSVETDHFLQEGIVLKDTEPEELRRLMYSSERGMKVLPEQAADGYIAKLMEYGAYVTYILPIEPLNVSTLVFLVKDVYYDRLLGCSPDARRQNYILYQGETVVLRENGEERLEVEAVLAEYEERGEPQFCFVSGGREYLVSLREGDSGLLYVTAQPMELFHDKIQTEQWGILLFIFLCGTTAALVIILLSYSLRSRVRHVGILIEGELNGDFSLEGIESGICTLLEKNRRIEEDQLLRQRTRFITSFLRGEYHNRGEAVAAGREARLDVDKACYAVILVGGHENSGDHLLYETILSEILKEPFSGYGLRFAYRNQSLFVIFGPEASRIEWLEETLLQAWGQKDGDFIIAASGIHSSFDEIADAYFEADTAYSSRYLQDNSEVLRYKDTVQSKPLAILPDFYLSRLEKAILTNDRNVAYSAVEEICDYFQTSGQTLLAFRIMCNDVIHLLERERSKNDAGWKSSYNVFELAQCRSIRNFKEILRNVCDSLIMPEQLAAKEGLVFRAQQYMKEHYGEADLNMSALAAYLDISAAMLSVEFKKKAGISPSDYLAAIRIERAKELLGDTDTLVRDVGLAVGYEDSIVFTRKFKKYTGKTPSQYRADYVSNV